VNAGVDPMAVELLRVGPSIKASAGEKPLNDARFTPTDPDCGSRARTSRLFLAEGRVLKPGRTITVAPGDVYSGASRTSGSNDVGDGNAPGSIVVVRWPRRCWRRSC
jgi:hypothetical protein